MRAHVFCFPIVLVAASVFATPSEAQQGVQWQPTLEGAKRLAAQSNRLVLVHFWAPWCHACRRMEQDVFARGDVAAALEPNYVAVRLNADHFPATARQFGVTSLPTDVMVTSDGQPVDRITGALGASQYIDKLAQVAATMQAPPRQQYAGGPPSPGMPPANQRARGGAAGYQSSRAGGPGASGRPEVRDGYGNSATPSGSRPNPAATGTYADQAAPSTAPSSWATPGAGPARAETGPRYANQDRSVASAPSYGEYSSASTPPSPTTGSMTHQPQPAWGQRSTEAPTRWNQNPRQQPAADKYAGSGYANNPGPQRSVPGGSPADADKPRYAGYGGEPTDYASHDARNARGGRSASHEPQSYQERQPSGPPASGAELASASPGAGNHPPLGLDGYCPVTLAEEQQWMLGDRRWGAVHEGRTYLFRGPEEQQRFLARPEQYGPVMSGDDVVLAVDDGRSVPWRREHGVFYGGRIFLFSNEASLEKFSRLPDRYASAATQSSRIPVNRVYR
jgi:thiol-disulfide isomerase/thioredoxin/YHS domain-containing protein